MISFSERSFDGKCVGAVGLAFDFEDDGQRVKGENMEYDPAAAARSRELLNSLFNFLDARREIEPMKT